MRLIALFIALVSFLVAGCDKADKEPEFAATYKGTFVRMGDSPSYSPVVAAVSLHFMENSYTGTSTSKNYPAICSGSFTISQSKININNNCVFTADFDWSFIFKGEYNYELVGDQLRIWRKYANGYQDNYTLIKE